MPLFSSQATSLLTALPNETLFSISSRQHAFWGHSLARKTSLLLYGKAQGGYHHDLPNCLHAFCERTENCYGDITEICLERTLLRFYRRFISINEIANAITVMSGKNVRHLKLKLGLLTSRFRANHPLKVCPSCIRRDAESVGWTYWHIEHQYPGVWYCNAHGELLSESEIKSNGVERFQWILPNLQHLKTPLVDANAIPQLAGLSKFIIDFVHSEPEFSVDFSRMYLLYRRTLKEQGYQIGKRFRFAEITSSFQKYLHAFSGITELSGVLKTDTEIQNQLQTLLRPPRARPHCLFMLLFVMTSLVHAGNGAANNAVGNAPSKAAERPELAIGQSAVQLQDGTWLLLGGQDREARVSADGVIIDLASKKTTTLKAVLNTPRSGHTTTTLPDGTIFIFGGTDANGIPLNTAEIYHPDTGKSVVLNDPGVLARSQHTATLLPDGHLLLAGGKDLNGPVVQAELLDVATFQVESFGPKLAYARYAHQATLLPTNRVLIDGGLDRDRHTVAVSEVYNPATISFSAASDGQGNANGTGNDSGPAVAGSVPALVDGVSISQRFALIFSKPMLISSINSATVTLIGPSGSVAIKPVAGEGGLLLFVTPQIQLLPATRYTLFLDGVQDKHGGKLPFTALGFTTAALNSTSKTIVSSSTQGDASNLKNSASDTGNAAGPAKVSSTGNEAHESANSVAEGARSDLLEEEWIPNAAHFHGNWRIHGLRSASQSLPPLQAAEGVTALAGQVLTVRGNPLANATLSIGNLTAKTDSTGRFLLSGIMPGVQTLTIDATTSDRGKVRYGYYQVLTSIKAGKTNILDYTIWMSRLDLSSSVSIPSPTTQEMVLKSPRIPGLELHIPAGTVIRGRDGKIVTELNMTAIPIDRPPFPLPKLGVPTYFTIQPGGAVLQSTNGKAALGARLFYPNFYHQVPGARMTFWNYDARVKGWYEYGKGTVSPDGKQVIPDPGVVIYEFTGAMLALPNDAPPQGPGPDCQSKAGDPVDCATGLFQNEGTDLVIQDTIPIVIGRSYRPQDNVSRGFGIGTNLTYDMYIVGASAWTTTTNGAYTYADLILADGTHVHYPRINAGTTYVDAVYQNMSTPGKYFGSILKIIGTSHWLLTLSNGEQYTFGIADASPSARFAALRSMRDINGNSLTLTRDSASNLTQITSPNGRRVQLAYDASNRVIQASDDIGRVVTYDYDAAGRLSKVTDPDGKSESFTYDDQNFMLTVVNKNGKTKVTNVYDSNGRVAKQTYTDGTTNTFAYTLVDNATTQGELAVCSNLPTTLPGPYGQYPVSCTVGKGGRVTQIDVTDENGIVKRTHFNSAGYPVSITRALGKAEQQTTTYQRDPQSNLIVSKTDPSGTVTNYTYDAMGNMLTETQAAGTASAVTTTLTYNPNSTQIASITDPLGHTITISWDNVGRPISMKDANGNTQSVSYNNQGRILTATNGLGKNINLSYAGGDLVQVSDPLNNKTSFYRDVVGRLGAVTDALGNQSVVTSDNADRTISMADALHQVINKKYDEQGNLVQVTDPKGNAHRYQYDNRDFLSIYTDPLNVSETSVYDNMHNLVQQTNRNGQITKFTYDNLNRLVKVTYADNSTIVYGYDAGGRVTSLQDSVSGTTSYSYDILGRLTQVNSPQGSIGYTYYANGLRQSMSVSGQPTLSYSYDAGNRLIRIDQAAGVTNNNQAQSISFSYDAADRRTSTRLANGITINYSYDDADQLTGITYVQADGSTVIGNLNYSYDAAGRRTGITGSLARNTLPATTGNSNYDAANRLNTWGNQNLSYDANGNLLSDGSQTYVWNARGQLVQIKNSSGTVIASFQYDGEGRRISKTVNGITRNYLYDGINIVRETDAGNQFVAAYLSAGVDQVLTRQASTGGVISSSHYLSDALGSTLRLTDSAGNKQVDYSYDPYGGTTADGNTENPFQYTGRENDGNGLYYYRARYYSPALHRFISSDPIGLNGGINTYGYVRGNPIIRRDPYGLWDFVFGAGGHISGPIPPGFAGGVTFYSSWTPGQGLDGANYDGAAWEGIAGEIFDLGVNAGVGGFSNSNGTPWSINIGAGKYAGMQINFKGSHVDGLSLGLGIALTLPVTITFPAKQQDDPCRK